MVNPLEKKNILYQPHNRKWTESVTTKDDFREIITWQTIGKRYYYQINFYQIHKKTLVFYKYAVGHNSEP